MALHQMKMPDIGEGVVDAEVVAWHVKVGDRVNEDQHFVDVMTDKATVEMSSPVSGTVVELRAEPGERIAVGAPLIVFETGAAADAGAVAVGAGHARDSEPASAAALPAAAISVGAGHARDPAPATTSPTAVAISVGAGNSNGPRDDRAQGALPPRAPAPAPPPARTGAAQRLAAAPAVRRRAREAHVELEDVPATGRGGRVTHADLDSFIAGGGIRRVVPQAAASAPAAPAARAPAPPMPAATPAARAPAPASAQPVTTMKLIGLRRVIAEKMALSKRRIPHYAYVEEVDLTDLEALRAHLNEQRRADQPKLTYLPFIVRALVKALRDFPQCNAHFDDEAGVVTQHTAVHAGIAAQTPNGLMVPVLRDAGALDLWQIAAEIQRLSTAARTGKASREELSGSTITITSLGKLGGIASTPVINHPEVAILGINKSELRPVVRDGAIVARLMMNLSASFDHRIVDGHDGASLVQAVKGLLEFPATIFI